MEITILGCGSSVGVPQIGCSCAVCASSEAKNKRGRSAILLSNEGKSLLIDFGSDIRSQILRENIKDIEAAILTHDHADHLHGIDDLKMFAVVKQKPLDIFSTPEVLDAITNRFPYLFGSPESKHYWEMQRLNAVPLAGFYANINLIGLDIQFFQQHHGRIDSLGIRVGNFAYSNDVIDFPPESFGCLEGLDIWVVDCLHEKSTTSHAGLEKALEWFEKFKPKQMILTNLSHSFDYYDLKSRLPQYIMPAFDGMKIKY